jgi:hypothetical protein
MPSDAQRDGQAPPRYWTFRWSPAAAERCHHGSLPDPSSIALLSSSELYIVAIAPKRECFRSPAGR